MKKLIISLLTMLMLISFVSTVFASDANSESKSVENYIYVASIAELGGSVFSVILILGIILSVIILIVLGIKYMKGTDEKKIEYKKTLTPYTIGAGVTFAVLIIIQIIYQFVQKI